MLLEIKAKQRALLTTLCPHDLARRPEHRRLLPRIANTIFGKQRCGCGVWCLGWAEWRIAREVPGLFEQELVPGPGRLAFGELANRPQKLVTPVSDDGAGHDDDPSRP
jgi:hypothetical protein